MLLNARLRNVLLLTLTQATSSTAVTLVAAVGALAGYALASNKALATLPSTMSVLGAALSTIPASLITAALTSLSSGQLLHHRGWQVLLLTAVAMLLLALAGSVWRTSRAAGPTELAAAE